MPVFHTFCIILPSHWSRAGLDQDHQVGRLFGRLTVVDYPLMITSKVEPFSIPGMRNNWPRQSFAQLTLDLVQQGFHFFALVHRSYTQHFDFRNMTRNKTNLQREMLYKKNNNYFRTYMSFPFLRSIFLSISPSHGKSTILFTRKS